MNHLAIKKAERRRRDTTNQENITTISVRKEVTKRDHIITTMPDTNMKMDTRNIMDTKKSTEKKVCFSLSIIRFDANTIKNILSFFLLILHIVFSDLCVCILTQAEVITIKSGDIKKEKDINYILKWKNEKKTLKKPINEALLKLWFYLAFFNLTHFPLQILKSNLMPSGVYFWLYFAEPLRSIFSNDNEFIKHTFY